MSLNIYSLIWKFLRNYIVALLVILLPIHRLLHHLHCKSTVFLFFILFVFFCFNFYSIGLLSTGSKLKLPPVAMETRERMDIANHDKSVCYSKLVVIDLTVVITNIFIDSTGSFWSVPRFSLLDGVSFFSVSELYTIKWKHLKVSVVSCAVYCTLLHCVVLY